MTLNVTPLPGDRLPVRRPLSEFVVETLSDEVLVYDQSDHAAHCLSPAAALVWSLCDGRSTLGDAAAALRTSGHVEPVVAIVAQLTAARLVVPAVAATVATSLQRSRRSVNRSRRAMLSQGAVVAGVVLASPMIFSIIAPSVAEAASSVGCGKISQPCCQPGDTCDIPLSCDGPAPGGRCS